MFGCYRKAEANDPDVYAGAVTAVLAEYPAEVIKLVTDPRTGIPRKLKWLPTVAEVADECDAARRFLEAKAIVDSRPPRLERPVPVRSPETDAEMARRFEELKARLSLKPMPFAPVERQDGEHAKRVKAELELRAAKREVA